MRELDNDIVPSMHYLKHRDYYYKEAEVTGRSIEKLILIEAAFNSLDEEDRHILQEEYLSNKTWNWWVAEYPKSTFYRYKKRAIIRFLTLLNSSIDDVKI